MLIAFSAPVLASDAKPAPKADAGQGADHRDPGLRRLPYRSTARAALPANPILQGQHPEYLVKQLHDFKSGARNNAIMKGFATTLSDQDMRERGGVLCLEDRQARLRHQQGHLLLGERIYRGGIADRRIAACAGCHSPNGAGIPVQYPRLGGQHGDYTEAQLIAFRSGERTNSLQMAGVAAKLNDREIKAVADYMAGLR